MRHRGRESRGEGGRKDLLATPGFLLLLGSGRPFRLFWHAGFVTPHGAVPNLIIVDLQSRFAMIKIDLEP